MSDNTITLTVKGKPVDGALGTALLLRILLNGFLPSSTVQLDDSVKGALPREELDAIDSKYREEMMENDMVDTLDEVMSVNGVTFRIVVDNS